MKKLFFILILTCMGVAAQAQEIRRSWTGELNAMGQKLPIVLNLNNGKFTLDSPAQGAKDIPATIDLLTKDSLKISIKTLNATYVARSVKGELEGTFTQNGFKLPLNMKETSPDGPNRPQTPKPPFPYDTEDVTFTNDKAGATLAGTLTIPADAKCVLLMVTGSGAQNRDEEVFEHKPFAVIAVRELPPYAMTTELQASLLAVWMPTPPPKTLPKMLRRVSSGSVHLNDSRR